MTIGAARTSAIGDSVKAIPRVAGEVIAERVECALAEPLERESGR